MENWDSIKLEENAVLLLGNGASRSIDNQAFDYTTLLGRSGLCVTSKRSFELVGESDFEKALLRLEITKETNKAVGLEETTTQYYINEIRKGLVDAVQSIHPPQGLSFDAEKAANAITFMSKFSSVFTLNYDFFLYWLINMANSANNSNRYFKDGFWDDKKFCHEQIGLLEKPRNGLKATVCYFLHGGLHLVDNPEQKLVLDEYDELSNTKLTQKVEESWSSGKRPLFVSEGSAPLKEARIDESAYLRFTFKQFKHKIEGKSFEPDWESWTGCWI